MNKLAGTVAVIVAFCLLNSFSVARASVNIMPLGDSITDGVGSAAGGGYRAPLYTDLQNAGYSFTFVGSATDNPGPLPASQQHHEGHPGYRVDQIANNLDGSDGTGGNNGGSWFHNGAQPDIILLHIGTNDILQNFDVANLNARIDALVNQIVTDKPSADLIISSIIPIDNPTDNAEVQAYNTYIKNVLVPKYDALHDHVSYVDQYANFVDAGGNLKSNLYAGDGIHPDDAGYALMATTWANGIAAIPEPASLAMFSVASLFVLSRRHLRAERIDRI
jgi:lysophospholipase L1-like esterase